MRRALSTCDECVCCMRAKIVNNSDKVRVSRERDGVSSWD